MADAPGALLLRLHSLGDVVLASAAARHLVATHGRCCFLTDEQNLPVLARMGRGVEPIGRAGTGSGMKALRIAMGRARSGGCAGAVFDLQGNLTTLLALWPSRAQARLRTDRAARRALLRKGSSGSRARLPYRAAEFLRLVGGEGSALPCLERPRSDASTKDPGRPAIGIVTDGRWPLKTIPAGVVAELTRIYVDLAGARVKLIGSPGVEREASIAGIGRDGVEKARPSSVAELMETVSSLDLLVSPDSGPAHLACAMEVPVLVFFSSTAPALGFWLEDPAGYPGRVAYWMVDGLDCRPCHRHGGTACRRGGAALCRSAIVPLALARASMELLG
ncbi:glycosyltransferase family 9 protein [Candidatus Fermentibacterales bacterium]|nr:glycosyltransferase family 9 protein [Candidatus Fermentibacterales bacterium]